jgi:hypothetical protein
VPFRFDSQRSDEASIAERANLPPTDHLGGLYRPDGDTTDERPGG